MPIDPQRWLRLSPWLDRLLERPAGEREGWLAELARHEPALAAELQALVAGDAAKAGARALQEAAPAEALPPLPAFASLPPLTGRRIGAYTLIEPLGEGGMGAVWLAERSDGRFEGRAAVKLLHAGIVQRALAARFKREGAILARLSHPHIARLIDAGLTDDGQPYLVLEHVAGERIDRWCDARRLDLRARLVLFAQVLLAVQHAHGQLVVHRDLKPANVMVDEQGTVKLLDFGIAKMLDDGDLPAEATELTREGGRVLTPLYAAPEQTRGAAVTTATDVYALGLLLYLLLTGQHPCVDGQGHHRPHAAELHELPLASRIVTDRGRRSDDDLSAAATARRSTPAKLGHDLAGDLDNILAKALRVEPVERYTTVAALADDLQRHLEGHTVSARPDSLAYRTSRFVGRHKTGVALATLALVAIVTAAGVAEHQRRELVRERDSVSRQRANAEAVASFLEEQLGQLVTSERRADPSERVDAAQRRAEQLFFDLPEVLARLHVVFHNLNLPLDRPAARRRNLDAIDAHAARINDPIARAEASCVAGWREATVAEGMARVDRTLAALPATDDSRFVRSKCLAIRAVHLKAAGRFDEALQVLEDSWEAAPEPLRRVQATAYLRNKGWLLNDLARPHAADQFFRQAAESMEAAGQGTSVRMASDLSWRAMLHLRMGRPREALEHAQRAAALADQAATGAPVLPFAAVVGGRALLELDRKDEARRRFDSALWRDGRMHTLFNRSLDFTALALRARGESAVAVEQLEEDLRKHGQKGAAQRDAMNRLALVGELLELDAAPRALAALDALGDGPEIRTFAWERHWLAARAHRAQGQLAQAEAAAHAAIAEALRRAPPQGRSALHGHAYLELARALAAQGRSGEARAAAERALTELDDALGPQHGATRAAAALTRS